MQFSQLFSYNKVNKSYSFSTPKLGFISEYYTIGDDWKIDDVLI
jgi:hypothetical protein